MREIAIGPRGSIKLLQERESFKNGLDHVVKRLHLVILTSNKILFNIFRIFLIKN